MARMEATIARGKQRARATADLDQRPPGYKRCLECGRVLLVSNINFHHRTASPDGYNHMCRPCDLRYKKMRRAENVFNQR